VAVLLENSVHARPSGEVSQSLSELKRPAFFQRRSPESRNRDHHLIKRRKDDHHSDSHSDKKSDSNTDSSSDTSTDSSTDSNSDSEENTDDEDGQVQEEEANEGRSKYISNALALLAVKSDNKLTAF
ncbi:hypothetical protein IWQ62_002705, partial [Dispira parvispora]